MSRSEKIVTGIKYGVFVSVIVVLGVLFYNMFFSSPLIMQGIIVDKVYIPKESANSNNVLPYMRYRSNDYTISTQKHEQWIAFVKLDDGQILKVDCHSDHYASKHIGDTLHFKEYNGDLFGIDYFSHNEEDEEREKGS